MTLLVQEKEEEEKGKEEGARRHPFEFWLLPTHLSSYPPFPDILIYPYII